MSDTVEHSGPPTPPNENGYHKPESPLQSPEPVISEAQRKQALRDDAVARAKLLADPSADPQAHVRALFYSLIYWDRPVHSGVALGASLSILILSAYFSPIRFFAGLWSLAITANLVFVHGMLQFKRLTGKSAENPHGDRMKLAEGGVLERGMIDRWVGLAVDGVNLAAQTGGKIVLIEDTRRSLTWLGWGLGVYILSGWMSTKWILGLGILLSFSVPKLYIENKKVVDEHIALANELAREQAGKAHALAQEHAGPYYEKATALGQQYGLIPKPKGE